MSCFLFFLFLLFPFFFFPESALAACTLSGSMLGDRALNVISQTSTNETSTVSASAQASISVAVDGSSPILNHNQTVLQSSQSTNVSISVPTSVLHGLSNSLNVSTAGSNDATAIDSSLNAASISSSIGTNASTSSPTLSATASTPQIPVSSAAITNAILNHVLLRPGNAGSSSHFYAQVRFIWVCWFTLDS